METLDTGTYQSFKAVDELHVQGFRWICRSFRDGAVIFAKS